MTAIRLSAQQARLLHLAAQGLLARPGRRARKADVLAAIARMRVLQIDTINVVARSPYLVLFSRLGAYRKEWLEAWLAEGAIFECWAHEASFAPALDYALHRRHVDGRDGHWSMKHARRMRREHAAEMDSLLAHVRERGAVKAADFERVDGVGGGGWWGWKSEKRWLEALFALGELMIARRENFQRVYDLGERVRAAARANGHVPDADEVSEEHMRREFTLGAVRALGVTQARWINDYFRSGRKLKDADLDAFVEAGELLRVDVEGWKHPAYVHPDHREALASAAVGRLRATHTTLLSPFDPVVWDRERAAAMFGFDYRIECYVPAPKRRYGYYVLPILHRGRLVGRLDAKAHRADGRFEVKALYLEEGVEADAKLAAAVAEAIRRCADWHATPQVELGRCEPKTFKRELREALRRDG
ncbi:crosslink repair DNA glycosylase YcaQ family protein [Dokdonella sp.]|uniref:winged helix-turn-helix domain-containing protein n=1 Tax=Dokdonella sp. TaxID=2291710 RepID=UPI001B020F5D|nr:crosslink repair DNA glycosylase YcaQ family protein [Dokdonella sp.]MBO9663331.1 YcaQ family DNA glycosylase [Dokdonella sp.]